MDVKVRLFATLCENRRKELEMSFADVVTPREIIGQLAIDEKDVAILLINGRDGALDQELSDMDVVSIFPPVGGG